MVWLLTLLLASVDVSGSACLGGTHEAVSALLVELTEQSRRKPSVDIVVAAREEDEKTIVTLTMVVPPGDEILSRSFEVEPGDCEAAPKLVTTIIRRRLTALKLEDWTEDPGPDIFATPTPAPLPTPVARAEVKTYAAGAITGKAQPLGAELEVSGARVQGASVVTLAVRADAPTRFGDGSVQQTAALLGLGFRVQRGRWFLQGEGRPGLVLVSGSGFTTNRRVLLPWLEASLTTAWRLGSFWVGPQISASPVPHELLLGGVEQNQGVAQLRLGLFVATDPK